MRKKFKNKPCVYCLNGPSTRTGDHVFAREFFVEDGRDYLPKIPACEACNNEKSQLEHYLTAVLPFGGRHPDGLKNLQDNVPGRLEKNLRLHRELAEGRARVIIEETAGQALQLLTVPFDGKILERLFRFIVKGLVFHHWGATLGDKHGVRVITITPTGQEAFAVFLGINTRRQVSNDLGNGAFRYEGGQGDYPELTVWRFSIYGGLVMAGDPNAPHEIATGIGAMTATKDFLARPAVVNIFGEAT